MKKVFLKRIMAVLMSITMIGSLVACGNSESSSSAEKGGTTGSSEDTIKIGILSLS